MSKYEQAHGVMGLEEAWRSFEDFSLKELDSGGPDHHITEIATLAHRHYPETDFEPHRVQRAWLVACYLGPYNVPGGLAIHQAFPAPQSVSGAEGWFRGNWNHLPIRKERRPARSPARMAGYLATAAAWVDDLPPIDASFTELWDSLKRVQYVGRYSGSKLLEAMRRADVTFERQPDIRPAGAKYPRRSLARLYPRYVEKLAGDRRRDDDFVNTLAADVIARVGIPDMFTVETLLCDWNQSLNGSYYPGRPLDSELDQLEQAGPILSRSDRDVVFNARAALFPAVHLGELQGWGGRRKELGRTPIDHFYVWTDRDLDYGATTDLASPVSR